MQKKVSQYLILFHVLLSAHSLSKNYEEIVVVGSQQENFSLIEEKTQRLLSVPGASTDPLKAVYALPGVTFSGGWQTHDPIIRGSAPKDNSYYIDGIPANYIFHVFGTSIFEKSSIRSFDLYGSGFTGFYNDAIGGIIDVKLREPKHQDFSTIVLWSFIKASVFVEAEVSENSAFYASYRKSLLREYDALIDLKTLASEGQSGFDVTHLPADQDYLINYHWQVSDNQSLKFTALGARDDLGATFSEGNNLVGRDPDFAGSAEIHQGFDQLGFHYNEAFSDKNYRLTGSLFYINSFDRSDFGKNQHDYTEYKHLFSRLNLSTRLAKHHQITFGTTLEHFTYDIDIYAKVAPCTGSFEQECPTVNQPFQTIDKQEAFFISSFFLQDRVSLNESFYLTASLHSTYHDHLEAFAIEPRARLDYFFSEDLSFYLQGGFYSQAPEILQLVEPTGNPELTFEKSKHIQVGKTFRLTDQLTWQTDLYFKTFSDLVLIDENKRYTNAGIGSAYGIEFFLNKAPSDRWFGWASLGLSKTDRKNNITGETFKFVYDKPIIINLVGNYELTDNWTLGGKWSLQSGGRYTAITTLEENEQYQGTYDPVFGEQNAFRLPLYHQLDIRAEYLQKKRWGYWKFFTDILNAYNQKNVNGYRYAPNKEDTITPPKGFGADVPVSASKGLGIIPSLGIEVKF